MTDLPGNSLPHIGSLSIRSLSWPIHPRRLPDRWHPLQRLNHPNLLPPRGLRSNDWRMMNAGHVRAKRQKVCHVIAEENKQVRDTNSCYWLDQYDTNYRCIDSALDRCRRASTSISRQRRMGLLCAQLDQTDDPGSISSGWSTKHVARF